HQPESQTLLADAEEPTETESGFAKLRARPTRAMPIDQVRALSLVESVARALHVAHETGVIHRDVKPGNVMIRTNNDPVILDFGPARDLEFDASSVTEPGAFAGTPAYMSPEQLTQPSNTLDRRTDVYSLGVVLYECLTLRRPFEAPTRDSLF